MVTPLTSSGVIPNISWPEPSTLPSEETLERTARDILHYQEFRLLICVKAVQSNEDPFGANPLCDHGGVRKNAEIEDTLAKRPGSR